MSRNIKQRFRSLVGAPLAGAGDIVRATTSERAEQAAGQPLPVLRCGMVLGAARRVLELIVRLQVREKIVFHAVRLDETFRALS